MNSESYPSSSGEAEKNKDTYRPSGLDEKNGTIQLNRQEAVCAYASQLNMSPRDLEELIEGKVVLDSGSSHGGFAKDIAAKHIDTKVISINPILTKKAFRKKEREFTDYYAGDFSEGNFIVDSKKKDKIQSIHDEGAVAAYSQQLPLPNASIDVIFDSYAAYHYGDREDYEKFILETQRVLKNDGILLIAGDIGLGRNGRTVESDEQFLRENNIPFERITKESGYLLGYIIHKNIEKPE